MLDKMLTSRGIDRIYEYNPSKKFLEELMITYDLHELVEEDLTELATQDKVDVYDQCMFIVLHFPKYDNLSHRYIQNEFNCILGKNYIITLTDYQTKHIASLKQELMEDLSEAEDDEKHKFSPYYLLYRIMDTMYDKTIRALTAFTKDLRTIETGIFRKHNLDKVLLEQIMAKKRSAISLKHMFLPHQEIIGPLQQEMLKFFGGELDVYFEDLAYKIDKILNMVEIIHEDVESLYDTYNAMVNMKTNTIITLLTIFTALTGVLTLISGFFGMNVVLPGAQDPFMMRYLLWSMVVLVVILLLFFVRKKRL